jgi:hypothetical protein
MGVSGILGMPLPPEWWVTGMFSSWHVAQIGSYTDDDNGSIHGVSGDAPGSSTLLMPWSLHQRMSFTASSTSLRKICA